MAGKGVTTGAETWLVPARTFLPAFFFLSLLSSFPLSFPSFINPHIQGYLFENQTNKKKEENKFKNNGDREREREM